MAFSSTLHHAISSGHMQPLSLCCWNPFSFLHPFASLAHTTGIPVEFFNAGELSKATLTHCLLSNSNSCAAQATLLIFSTFDKANPLNILKEELTLSTCHSPMVVHIFILT